VPPPSPAKTFACASLVPARQIASLTGLPAAYVDLAKIAGVKAPKLPKGETECKAIGNRPSVANMAILTTTVTVFTGPSRSVVDDHWPAFVASGLATPVSGLGDVAMFYAPTNSLVGYQGGAAFQITLEPFPLTLFSRARVLAIDSALAKTLLAHLG
jgi:hypothetical protein